MKLIYKPFSLIFTLTAGWMGRGIFRSLWERIDAEDPPPQATAYEASLGKVIGAAALKAVTMTTVSAAANRAAARSFHYLTGIWPEDGTERKEGRREARARDRE